MYFIYVNFTEWLACEFFFFFLLLSSREKEKSKREKRNKTFFGGFFFVLSLCAEQWANWTLGKMWMMWKQFVVSLFLHYTFFLEHKMNHHNMREAWYVVRYTFLDTLRITNNKNNKIIFINFYYPMLYLKWWRGNIS